MQTRREALRAMSVAMAGLFLNARSEPNRADSQSLTLHEANKRRARAVTDKLLRGVEGPSREAEGFGLCLPDVEATVDRFALQLRYSTSRHLKVWAAEFDGLKPVPIKWGLPSDPFWLARAGDMDNYLKFQFGVYGRLASVSREWTGFTLAQISPDEAKQNFADGLTAFLARRFDAKSRLPEQEPLRKEKGGSRLSLEQANTRGASLGIQFRVFTQKNGQRVRYTMSYFPDIANPPVFGSPTSPVNGWIQPGLWKFAVDGPRSPLRFDPANFPVPPLKQAHLNV